MSDKLKFEEKMMKQTLFRKTWILKVVAILITYHLSLTATEAQTFTQRIQQQTAGGGRVVLHQDAAIDELVNGKPVATPLPRQTTGQTTGQTNRQQQQQQRSNEGQSDARDQQRNDNLPAANEAQEAHADSVAQTPQRTRKVMGYRIQVYAGGKTRADRQKAEQTANTIKTLFPGHKVYVHFYSPRWICRMGNFRTLAEAKEVLNEVVRMGYDTATLVRGKITVAY
jgi:hypothetical protein